MSADKYTEETITSLTIWADNLFSFRTTRQLAYRFIAGQFARLGVRGLEGDIVWRPYSMVSATYDEFLEFYSIIVPDGLFTQRLAKLKVGDTILVDKTNYGFLTTDRFESGKDLWLLSTGTGLAPFISILYDFKTWEDYEHIVLVHSVRHRHEFAYEQLIAEFKTHEFFAPFAHKLIYQQLVSRDYIDNVLHGRITTVLESGELERAVGFEIDKERARIMICGNPAMVADTRKLLIARGLTMTRSAKPGNIAVENYW